MNRHSAVRTELIFRPQLMAAVAAVPLRLLNHMLSCPFSSAVEQASSSSAPAPTHACEGSVHDPLRGAHPPNRLSSADVPECSVAPVWYPRAGLLDRGY